MTGVKRFLWDKVADYDLVMVEVLGEPAPQTFRARVRRIYSARKGVNAASLGAEIEFVGCPPHWGQVELKVGETALVFLGNSSSGRLYEHPWRGHLVVEQIDGGAYAIYLHKALWLADSVPPSLSACMRQDPKRPNASAVQLDALEAYLTGLIEQVDSGGK